MTTMKMTTMSCVKGEWPATHRCVLCSRSAKADDCVLVGRSNVVGTVLFHDHCILNLVDSLYPVRAVENVRKHILANDGDPFGFRDLEPIEL